MAYINGNQLNIFPISNRTSKPYDNWLTEFNLSSIINQLVGNQTGFVITETVRANDPIEFNIGGYYFKVAQASYIKSAVDEKTDSGSSLSSFVTFEEDGSGYYTASIKVSKDTDNPILLGSDDLTDIPTILFDTKTLKLFNSNYQVPSESRLSLIILNDLTVKGKLDAAALHALSLDDGELPEHPLNSIDDGNLANPESISTLIINDGNFRYPESLKGTGDINDGNITK